MRTPTLALLAGLSVSGLALATATTNTIIRASDPPPRTLLRGSECLDPQRARGWTQLDDGDLLVDAGRQKYRVTLISACTAAGYTNAIQFRGDPVSGRVCGSIHDQVITRDYPCRIERMELLDKAQYELALKEDREIRKAKRAAKKAKAD